MTQHTLVVSGHGSLLTLATQRVLQARSRPYPRPFPGALDILLTTGTGHFLKAVSFSYMICIVEMLTQSDCSKV